MTAEEAVRWAKRHWRPAHEGAAAAALGGATLAALGAGVMGAAAPILMLPAAAALGTLALIRGARAAAVLRARARLWGVAPEAFTLADLAAHLKQLATGPEKPRSRGARGAGLYRAALRMAQGAQPIFDAQRLPDVSSLWLGLGFDWGSGEAQLLSMLPSSDWRRVCAPAALLPLLRTKPVLGDARIGSPVLHGVGLSERALDVPFSAMGAGLLIVGTTQAGKGVLLSNLIAQAVFRGDVVIVIDPKFSARLFRAVGEAARAAGRRSPLLLHPSKPEESVRLDPLANFQRPTEIASRLRAVIGSDAKEFADLSWAAANAVVEALLYVGERPTLAAIEKYITVGLDEVLEKALKMTLDAGWQALSHSAPGARMNGFSPAGGHGSESMTPRQADWDWRSEAEALLKKSGGGRSARLAILVAFWDDALARAQFCKNVGARLGERAIDRVNAMIAACEPRAREQTAKVTGSLRTALAKLSGGELGPLLSPDPADPDDPRTATTLAKIVRGGDILYVGLDSLTDTAVAESLGMLLLADLASLAGELYNRGESGDAERRISLFVDETSNVINQPLIELLNKGREAGIRTTCAMQTTADLEAMLGSRAKALQALGNLNNVIALRTIDPETQRFVEALLGRSSRETAGRSATLAREEALTGEVRISTGKNARKEAAPLIDGDRLRELPNLEFFASMGGRLMKGRALFLDPAGVDRRLFDEAGSLLPEADPIRKLISDCVEKKRCDASFSRAAKAFFARRRAS